MERTQQPDPTPKRGPEHERLEAFLGDWHLEGKNLEGADEHAGTTVTGTQKAEWLPGQFFLMQREEVDFGKSSHQTTWITQWDAVRKRYVVQFFDSLGYTRTYDMMVDGSTWRFEGLRERGTITFDDDGNSFRGTWERFTQRRWVPLCEYRATRVH